MILFGRRTRVEELRERVAQAEYAERVYQEALNKIAFTVPLGSAAWVIATDVLIETLSRRARELGIGAPDPPAPGR